MDRVMEYFFPYVRITEIEDSFDIGVFIDIFSELLEGTQKIGHFMLENRPYDSQFSLAYSLFPQRRSDILHLQRDMSRLGISTERIISSIAGDRTDLYSNHSSPWGEPDNKRGLWEPQNLPSYGSSLYSPKQTLIEASWNEENPLAVGEYMSAEKNRYFSVFFKLSDVDDGYYAIAQSNRYRSMNRYKYSSDAQFPEYDLWDIRLEAEHEFPFLMDLNCSSLTSAQLAKLIAPIHPAKLSAPVREYVNYIETNTPSWID